VGAQKVSRSRCAPCRAGHECRGGPDVRECAVGTYSGGNRSACTRCSECEEVCCFGFAGFSKFMV